MQPIIDEEFLDSFVRHMPTERRDELIMDIFDCLHNISNVADEQSHEIEKMTGLNKNQALAVKIISRLPAIHVSQLARKMFLKPATMVRIIDQLEERGLVTRTRSLEDRRVVEIGLTEKAADIELIVRNSAQDSLQHCLKSANDRELKTILEVLQRLSSLIDYGYVETLRL